MEKTLPGETRIERPSILLPKKINYPEMSETLAEFIGICLGDGTLTPYFIRISGDKRYDKKYFEHVSKIVHALFGISTSIFSEKARNTMYLQISSKLVCTYLNGTYGLPMGNKRNSIKVPDAIKGNEKLEIAFLRGLVDTDGSVSRRGKQFTVQFISDYPGFLKDISQIGKHLGVFTYLNGDETGTNSWSRVVKYFALVGSSNPKHIIRFSERYLHNRLIYLNELNELQEKSEYKNMCLPYKIQ